MHTAVLRLNRLPSWDDQVVTALHRVASMHPSRESAIAVTFSDQGGEIYRTATINGVLQFAKLEQELRAIGLTAGAAPHEKSQVAGVVNFLCSGDTPPPAS